MQIIFPDLSRSTDTYTVICNPTIEFDKIPIN